MNAAVPEGLDAFSASFAEPLFAALPELRDHARVENGILTVEVAPPPAREDAHLWIDTDCDEVTVGFGMYHTHFDWPCAAAPDDPYYAHPITLVRSFVTGEIRIAVRFRDGRWAASSLLDPGEEPEPPAAGEVVHIRSWSGDDDRNLTGP